MSARQAVLDQPRWLTIAEVAADRRVHVNTVRRWISAGFLLARGRGPFYIGPWLPVPAVLTTSLRVRYPAGRFGLTLSALPPRIKQKKE